MHCKVALVTSEFNLKADDVEICSHSVPLFCMQALDLIRTEFAARGIRRWMADSQR